MPTKLLITLLSSPERVSEISGEQWNGVVEQGRKNQMLGQLAARLRQAAVFDQVLPAVQRHLMLAELTAKRRAEAATWEMDGLRRAIDSSIPVVVLKGCAYVVAGDINANGRLFSDVDLMVPRRHLDAVETSLIAVGWKPSRVNAYDQAYYRNWMHEVPPMEHVRRHTVVDLHHAINPPISRQYVDPSLLIDALVEVKPGIFVLSPTDRVIHCALHLLQEGESKKLLRDLFDLHLLLGQHHAGPEGLNKLYLRAEQLNVGSLVKAAVAAAKTVFEDDAAQAREGGWLAGKVVHAALHAYGKKTWRGELAGMAVLAHSHWMKMPMHLLVPHLIRKAWMGSFPEKKADSVK